MSYEGYVQILCRNGHYTTMDCYAEEGVYPTPESVQERINEDKELIDGGYVTKEEAARWPKPEVWKCPVCGELMGWRNSVDTTNGPDVNRVELAEVSPAEHETCNLGHRHCVKPATYRPEGLNLYGCDGFLNGGLK